MYIQRSPRDRLGSRFDARPNRRQHPSYFRLSMRKPGDTRAVDICYYFRVFVCLDPQIQFHDQTMFCQVCFPKENVRATLSYFFESNISFVLRYDNLIQTSLAVV